MQAVIRLQGRIVQIRAAPDGDTVGYNAQWTARGARRLAVVSVGYADGYPRAASATDAKRDTQVAAGAAIVAGLHCPFAGRVSMDLIVVDITEVPAGAVKRGDLVDADRRRPHDRRGRPPRRHHRLRDPDEPRPALRPPLHRRSLKRMAKYQTSFVCQSCGAVYNRWKGRCEACGGWNTIVEETGAAHPLAGPVATRPSRAKGRVFPLEGLAGETHEAPRTPSGIAELDRVTGGGFVRGSAILIGGDPGIGKSTLLMQAAAALATGGQRVVYISGEEAIAQVRLRAERLGLGDAPVELAAETNVEDILATLAAGRAAGARRHRLDPDAVDRDASNRRPARSPRCAARRRR